MKLLRTRMNYRAERGKLITYLHARGEDKQPYTFKIMGIEPHFATPIIPPKMKEIKRVEQNKGKDIYGNPLHIVYTHYPFDVPKVRNQIRIQALKRNQTRYSGEKAQIRYAIKLDGTKSYSDYEADVVFTDVVAKICKMGAFIEVPNNALKEKVLTPKMIKPCDTYIEPRIAIIDIETNKRSGKIISINIYDSYLDKHFIVLLRDSFEYSQSDFMYNVKLKFADSYNDLFKFVDDYLKGCKPDLISGWFVQKFDIDKIHSEKPKNVGTKLLFDIPVLDAHECFDILWKGVLPRNSLEWASQETLGRGKIKYEGELIDLLLDDPVKFVNYNTTDCQLVKDILDAKQIIPYFLNIAHMSGTAIGDLIMYKTHYSKHKNLASMKIVENTIMQHLSGTKVFIPSKHKTELPGKVGGAVRDPFKGVKENVIVLDLKALYITLVRQFNISPDTLVDESYEGDCYIMGDGSRFRKDKRGIIPSIYDEKFEEREKLDSELSDLRSSGQTDSDRYKYLSDQRRALKDLLLSFWGVISSEHFRLADKEAGPAIPSGGQELSKWTAEWIEGYCPEDFKLTDNIELDEDFKIKVDYGDTDSLFFTCSETDFDILLKLAEIIESSLNDNYFLFAHKKGVKTSEPCYLEIEFEKIYEKMFMSLHTEKGEKKGRKRYCGLLSYNKGVDMREKSFEDRLDIVGYKRTDVPDYTIDFYDRLFIKIFTESLDEVKKLLWTEEDKFKHAKVDIDSIAMRKGLGRNLDTYQSNWEHVKAGRNGQKYLDYEFRGGDKIKYYFVSGIGVIGIPPDQRLPPDWVAKINMKRHIDRCLHKPTKYILEALNLNKVWDRLTSLDMFMEGEPDGK